ncbi:MULTISPECIES: outer membrane lipoprotein chaperone LolA [Hydrogenophaga]|uniref:Outer-membrane lipoprotein carrier protein n=1 Tax=Hydrogenophaga electricum TaxID=1230953 RepID=A0ABQ6C478_9BURK|nr:MULTISPECIES: outer membrane lipoprotein chaperone LolA [Hydrogenophaga]GLS13540.1 outer-membrane lipoprotein carrier protein [Hydrogenophaga electricum]
MIKPLLALATTFFLCLSARADGLQDLEAFLRDVRSAQANFTQVVTSPKREGEPSARTRTSSGRFEFLRPQRFRFEYTKPFEQTIVADGQTLWLHDVDLNQVTARKQQDVLGSTPAALIAGGTDIKTLSTVFDLKSLPAQDGMNWLEARPRARDGQIERVRVGFRDGQVAVLDIADSLGQQSVLTFSQWQANTALKAEKFRFTPPAGADVIRP